MAKWHYRGDMNLEHGGSFVNVADWRHGYATVVEVMDLGSAIGLRGAVSIETRTVSVARLERWPDCLGAIGLEQLEGGDIREVGREDSVLAKDSDAWKFAIAYALSRYGLYDRESERTVSVGPAEPRSPKAATWRVDKRLRRDASLERYVRRTTLREAA